MRRAWSHLVPRALQGHHLDVADPVAEDDPPASGKAAHGQHQVTAAEASAQVGYESSSQFSREFNRMVGRGPAEEASRIRQVFAAPDPSPHAVYVAAH